ncbi:TRIC cation channel family protein [Thorsellia anophelis]|uniref:Uncharacterized membrane protein YeiH n=1 Tax=Thorsellia anophelis DSM 18579 TaxID=1123402 RepID=A0A1H9Y551_9GAMM|nr:TRIC cation channel family protein [Thorsellia anophelis]SES63977.1 Uncharacterized membrane protein YeiH [Thorsellia anophelis DSM 18579]
MQFLYWLDILGTAVFAISGVLLAGKLKMDPFGVLVLGTVTAIGGGTIRDLLLDVPVFWIVDSTDLVIAILTCFVTIALVRAPAKLPRWLLPVLDAIGLAVFVGIGVNKAIGQEVNVLIAICMGVITGVGGGMIRDTLAREIPMILRKEVYATACIFGGATHAVSHVYFDVAQSIAMLLGITVTLLIRLTAIRWKLQLPTFALDNSA